MSRKGGLVPGRLRSQSVKYGTVVICLQILERNLKHQGVSGQSIEGVEACEAGEITNRRKIESPVCVGSLQKVSDIVV